MFGIPPRDERRKLQLAQNVEDFDVTKKATG
jgi:hypothetical protein